MPAGKKSPKKTVAVSVCRSSINLSNGRRQEFTVFKAEHGSVKALEKMLKVLASQKQLSGGDLVKWVKGGKPFTEYRICMYCEARPAELKSVKCNNCGSGIKPIANDYGPSLDDIMIFRTFGE